MSANKWWNSSRSCVFAVPVTVKNIVKNIGWMKISPSGRLPQMNAVYPRLTPLTPDERCNPQMNAVHSQINADCCLAILLPLLDPACLLLTHLLRMCVAACLLTGSSWHWCLALPAANPARDVLLPALPIAHSLWALLAADPVAGPVHSLLALLAADPVAGPAHSSFPVGPACCWPCRRPCP